MTYVDTYVNSIASTFKDVENIKENTFLVPKGNITIFIQRQLNEQFYI